MLSFKKFIAIQIFFLQKLWLITELLNIFTAQNKFLGAWLISQSNIIWVSMKFNTDRKKNIWKRGGGGGGEGNVKGKMAANINTVSDVHNCMSFVTCLKTKSNNIYIL